MTNLLQRIISMKLKQLFFALATTALFSTAQAQVKVGANPGTIGANSALEVEATNGKKVTVNKTDGSLTIGSVPSGAVTDSILTVDASGNVRSMNVSRIAGSGSATTPYLRLEGGVQAPASGASQTVVGLGAQLQNNIDYTPANGQVKIKEAGIYYYGFTSIGPGRPDGPSGVYDHCSSLSISGGANIHSVCSRTYPSGQGATATGTGIYRLKVGDVLTLYLSTAAVWAGGGGFAYQLSLYKLSD